MPVIPKINTVIPFSRFGFDQHHSDSMTALCLSSLQNHASHFGIDLKSANHMRLLKRVRHRFPYQLDALAHAFQVQSLIIYI